MLEAYRAFHNYSLASIARAVHARTDFSRTDQTFPFAALGRSFRLGERALVLCIADHGKRRTETKQPSMTADLHGIRLSSAMFLLHRPKSKKPTPQIRSLTTRALSTLNIERIPFDLMTAL